MEKFTPEGKHERNDEWLDFALTREEKANKAVIEEMKSAAESTILSKEDK